MLILMLILMLMLMLILMLMKPDTDAEGVGSIQEVQGELPFLRHCRRSRNPRTQTAEGSHFASCPERTIIKL